MKIEESVETDAMRLQREDVEQRPYLFQRAPGSSRWGKNMHGTIMSPVWVECSIYEDHLLNGGVAAVRA